MVLLYCVLAGAVPKARPVPRAPAVPKVVALPLTSYSLSLKQLGEKYSFDLRGVDGRYKIEFSVRGDEVITNAVFKLKYRYSSALLAETSQINILVNNELAASLPLPKATADTPLEQTIPLPVQMLSARNELTLQLVGHYSQQCEDPRHPDLWATIANDSALDLTTASLPVGTDLSLLPAPFYDKRDLRTFKLPFVFAGVPDNTTLEAAGVVSSWFGALARDKRSAMSAALNELPSHGNAVVFVSGNATLSELNLAPVTGPTVSILVNPRDVNGKLLMVMGRDSRELKQAAVALGTRSKTLHGQSMAVDGTLPLDARQPYDAPNWLSTRKPLAFGELVEAAALVRKGGQPEPVRLNLRLAPDLFDLHRRGVPVELKFQHTVLPEATVSRLTVDVNQKLVKSIALPSTASALGSDLKAQSQSLQIPMAALLPGVAQLQFRYTFDPAKEADCNFPNLDQVQSAVDPDSTIDLSGLSHFMAMPNLSSFVKSGFPFTRLADLSETAVVLPDAPGLDDYSAYLSLMARLGEATGYAGTAVHVVHANQAGSVADKDILLLASGSPSGLVHSWAQHIHGQQDENFLTDLPRKTRRLWGKLSPYLPADLRIAQVDESPWLRGDYGMLSGFESPLKAGRSVVMVWGTGAPQLLDSVEAAWGSADEAVTVGASLMLVQGEKIKTRPATPTYYIGDIGLIRHVQWIFSRDMGLLVLATALGIFLLSVLIYGFLRAQAARRTL